METMYAAKSNELAFPELENKSHDHRDFLV